MNSLERENSIQNCFLKAGKVFILFGLASICLELKKKLLSMALKLQKLIGLRVSLGLENWYPPTNTEAVRH